MQKNEILNRIAALRKLMIDNQIDAYVITGSDPHMSEYTPENWKTRQWISGFTGSFGKVLITLDRALLWTDTRYFLQANDELAGTGIVIMKERVPDAIPIEEWITANLGAGTTVGVDGYTLSAHDKAQFESKITAKGLLFRNDIDLVSVLWSKRPTLPISQIYEHEPIFAGKSRKEKIELVRSVLKAQGLHSTVISQLDDVAWLFNLRSDEIQYEPVFAAYSYIELDEAHLFIDQSKVSTDVRISLEDDSIKIHSYDSFITFLSRIHDQKIQFDPIRCNSMLINPITKSNSLELSVSITSLLKSVKDDKEIRNIKSAHIKDGAALVNSIFWIIQSVNKDVITEVSVGHKLNEFRGRQPLYKGESFHPIVSFGDHGAIVHYHATHQTDRIIKADNILLIDSGGQYLDGTTDITRTITMGSVTVQQKEDFTFCLKAHIALATAIFPIGTKGYSLDAITRKPLWDRGMNYGHGTGHGVGYFLSVHEGPMSIRAEFNNEPIREGHLLSNEPAIYREGEYGIRTENVILCKKYKSSEFGDFLCFETLSLCPIDRNLISLELLTKNEIDWINDYHSTVYNEVSPLITDRDTLEWLSLQCEPLS